jgi:cysteine synthase A
LRHLVGNTPLLAVRCRLRGEARVVYAKAENFNFTGSIKDRMALHILDRGREHGLLREGSTIAEATSGNTGIAFAALGRALGMRVVIYMPDWMSQERVMLIRSLGAEIVPVAREQGGFLGSIRMTQEMAAGHPEVFLPAQFSNDANCEAHALTTGPELARQLALRNLAPDVFVAGVGTGGTIMGVGRYLRSINPRVRLHAIEPAESPTLSTGCKVGQHRIQGVSDEFVPAIVELSVLDDVLAIHDGDAILMAQRLARDLGLAVGISSGANFLGALLAQARLGSGAVAATVFADSNKKYLSTDLLRTEPVREGYLSSRVELEGFDVLPRLAEPIAARAIPGAAR